MLHSITLMYLQQEGSNENVFVYIADTLLNILEEKRPTLLKFPTLKTKNIEIFLQKGVFEK